MIEPGLMLDPINSNLKNSPCLITLKLSDSFQITLQIPTKNHTFKTRTIRWGLGVPPETLQNMDVLDEPTRLC
jgi:hypothetical protein